MQLTPTKANQAEIKQSFRNRFGMINKDIFLFTFDFSLTTTTIAELIQLSLSLLFHNIIASVSGIIMIISELAFYN